MLPGHAADHSPPSSAAAMEEYSYNSTHPLGHIGPVTGSLYLIYIYIYYFFIKSTTGMPRLKIVTYCHLLLGPATVGQYLELEPRASEIA